MPHAARPGRSGGRPSRAAARPPRATGTSKNTVADTTATGSAPSASTAASAWARWPTSALLAWLGCWLLHALLLRLPLPAAFDALAPLAASALGLALSMRAGTRMRTLLTAGGFPLSWWLATQGSVPGAPAWAWLLPIGVLALVYPVTAWRDAPLFPTPAGALDGLADLAPLPPQARVLDAGCGLGHGLDALARAYPLARLAGVEWSRPLARAARWRCPHAEVRRGDMWRESWQGLQLVYLFQRPESLPRAVDKAQRELAPGAWLASLEFDAPMLVPQAVLQTPGGRPVWLYRRPFVERTGARGDGPRPPSAAAGQAASGIPGAAGRPDPAPCLK